MNTHVLMTRQAEDHVRSMYSGADTSRLVFHNLDHVTDVVTHTQELADHYRLPENEKAILLIAAWFHDVGYLSGGPHEHEQRSAGQMREFMAAHSTEEEFIKEVENCIMATRMDREPKNLLQEIIKDADTYHLGTDEFKKTNKRIRKERELREPAKAATIDWPLETLKFLETHRYYTTYCQENLNDQKRKAVMKYKKKVDEQVRAAAPAGSLFQQPEGKAGSEKQNGFINKGIQTMLRLTSENHLELSGMADGKANILISVNAIIISVILTVLIRKIEVDRHLAIPTFIFLFFSVTTIILAILATRPQVTEGQFSRNDVIQKKTNLLFFGNFFKTSLDEYKWAMSNLMQDPEYLYSNLVSDIHSLGVVLGRKYALVRKAYNLFMVGIIISVLAFILAIVLHSPQAGSVVNAESASPL